MLLHRSPASRCTLLVLAAVALAACKEDRPDRAPPPPPPPSSAKAAAACASGGGTIADAATAPLVPRTTAGFCLDPNGNDKAFGDQAPLPLEKICDIFDGECEIYKGFNVRRVAELRYVDGAGSPATIDIHLSKFATTEGAYGMFTKRIVGDGDPADEATPKPIEGGGAAALGLGNAYVWRGTYLGEITYNDESAAEATMKAAGERLLPPLVKEIGAHLPGDLAIPPSAAALPKEDRLPLGVRFVTKDVLGVDGVGGGAFGYFAAGGKRWRVLSIARADVDQAKDVLSSFAKLPGATKEKYVAEGAWRAMRKDGDNPAVEWVFARAGKLVMGVGDEERAMKSGMTPEEHAKVCLSKEDKIARVKRALGVP